MTAYSKVGSNAARFRRRLIASLETSSITGHSHRFLIAVVGGSEKDKRAIVIAEIQGSDQTPLEGIPLTNVSLANGAMVPIGDGPYYLGPAGDIDPDLTVSTAFNGRGARLAILNVPGGEATLTIALPPPDSNLSMTFTAEQDAVHLLLLH